MITELHAKPAIAVGADLAEGPFWHPPTKRLHFVDITAQRIYEHDPRSGALRFIDTGAMVGCVVPRANGHLLAALATGLWNIDPSTGERTFLVVPPEHDARRCRFNDGKCDPQGRLWAGTMGYDCEPRLGALYCFPTATTWRRAVADVTVSNGLAWSLNGQTLYYIDSPTRRVDAFDFDGERGEIRNRRAAFTLPEGTGVPDGCAMDADGMLWVAHWGGHGVTRWNPTTGEQLAVVRVPAPHVSSCAFGGDALDTLYITTARSKLKPEQLAAFPRSGDIFAVRPGVNGLPTQMCRG